MSSTIDTIPEFKFECDGLPDVMKSQDEPFVSCLAALHMCQNPDECWNYKFPGVSAEVADCYTGALMALERTFQVSDYFTQTDITKIVKAIDNHDYVKDVYPDRDVKWHGLLNDISIFLAIARFKKQNDNPRLVSVELVCSAIAQLVPKHLYYLKFRFPDGSGQIVSYRSGAEILINV